MWHALKAAPWSPRGSEERPGLRDLGALTVGVGGEGAELLVVAAGGARMAGELGRLGSTVEPTQPVRSGLHGGLELSQGLLGLLELEQQIAELLAHREEAVFHGDVLLARVLEIGRRLEQAHRLDVVLP